MLRWEQALGRFLHLLRLDDIKRKILVFALFATLIPSLTMGWLSYVQNTRVMTEKVSEELRVASSQTARELDIWIKQRVYELRVFSSSYEVSENLQKSRHGRVNPDALQRLKAYLKSVSEKFPDYEELLVINPEGVVVTTSAANINEVRLPPNWVLRARAGDSIMGDTYWEATGDKAVVTIAVPIKSTDDQLLGLLATTLNFHAVEQMMRNLSPRETVRMYLIDATGSLITSSRGALPALKDARFPPEVTDHMFAEKTTEAVTSALEYTNLIEQDVLGSVAFSTQQDWAILTEIGKADAYAQTIKIRNLTLLITVAVLILIGLSAYLLGVTIVRPLHRLTRGASEVASGNLGVEVPLVGGGEVGYLTEIFNYMVGKLREDQEELAAVNETLTRTNKELQEISITDSLTGLYNRRYMMEALTNETSRAERMQHKFSVLMIDIDHFKQYNDTYGHLAGDDLLIKVAALFKESIRDMDLAARYGGEEFLIILPEHGLDAARAVAERIRSRIEAATRDDSSETGAVTVSIGVSAFPENGTTPTALIDNADIALYRGKENGRNRVIVSDAKPDQPAAKRKRTVRKKLPRSS
ncbi:MAG TPA: diguanylate cyclase [Burkholderiales bacterium]|nr:diguanylate cyclase [Burkholderiales bacterium]